MHTLLSILFMTVVGAVIGGLTNFIAIKMLFRPHNPIYLGSWRLPFTPGLIPRRRDELAKQLGKTVVNYLLTPEMFRKKLFTEVNRRIVEQWLNDKIKENVFTEEKTINEWIQQIGIINLPQTIEGKIDTIVVEQMNHLQHVLSTNSIEALLPESWQAKATTKIPEISRYILQKGESYFESEEGYQTIKRLIDDFLDSKGTLGGMIQMFLGDSSSLVGRVQKEMNKFFNAPGTMVLLTNLLTSEWQKLKVQSVPQLLGELDFTSTTTRIQTYVKEELQLENRMDKPLVYYWKDGAEWLAQNIVPQLIAKGFVMAEDQLEEAINRLNLQEIVREQVDSFPVEVLEDLVLGISKREFKMITLLGYVLGGVIGVIQGVIVTIF
ncbi:DUF445 domain-containing protein [Rummeliibacillus pycnus]|uniref:DUF445 domain-containing protein n=1 Tax=Rummeliibacillus pycnus TaxID=101070 RepID=UPI000C9A3BFB|nr:DUF445 family protein [Rummeliibacillus pycnus]